MENTERIRSILKEFPNISRDSLIPILQKVQDDFGYLSEESVSVIGKYLNLPASKVYGLATFYNQFRFTPPGKYHIRVCDGTGCHLEGSGFLLKELEKSLGISDGETSRDGMFSLEVLSCIGACGHAPVISINGSYYSKLNKKKLNEIIDTIREEDT
jgi:NADH-quinone oxidoreductase subunit E